MADVRTVSDDFAVAPQIQPQEVQALAGRFKLLVNNRPDGEESGQPSAAELGEAARAAGVGYRHIPVTGLPTADQVKAMREALEAAPGPALAFCRTGTRSVVTWAAGQALNGRPVDALAEAGTRAGYDLRPHLDAILPRLRP